MDPKASQADKKAEDHFEKLKQCGRNLEHVIRTWDSCNRVERALILRAVADVMVQGDGRRRSDSS